MRRSVLVSVLAVGASLAAWCGIASAGYYGPGRGTTAPQTHDRYNNDHRDSEYAPGPRVYGYYCCEYNVYSHYQVRRPYYHHSDYHRHHDYYRHHYRHQDHYRSHHYRSDYGYRRWHRDDYDD